MDDETAAAEAAQVKGAVMKPWMIAVLASVVVILGIAGVIWLRSRKRNNEEPQEIEGAAAAALASAEAGDEAGAESASSSAESGAPAEASTAAPDASDAPEAPDLLTDAEQISDEEIDAGRTAALKKMLEERGRQ